ncbi:MAG: protein kinase [Acidobacteriota bacterium]|nr:protein kinase [Acidobacteriota bacterium]
MASETISHYRIIRKLDRGGMGEVYLAEDTRLGRPLALKLLLAEYTQDTARLRRFEQEARAASALNHPNILTIYEVGEAVGRHYIATEYVEGETLRQKIKRAPLPLGEAVDIAAQVAEALNAAHAAGIIHRDVKPENVMLRPDGYVKVLDFGLAKLVERRRADGEAETRMAETNPGAVMGTTWYMSPEQARGQTVDARTDVWSLGVVLYEMLSGSPPFVGSTASHVIVSILEREPPPVEKFLPGAPPELGDILARALAKDRDARYASAREMLEDLLALRRTLGEEGASRAAASRLIHETAEARREGATGGARKAHTTARTDADAPPRTGARARDTEELRFGTSIFRHGRKRQTAMLAAAISAAVILAGAFLLYMRHAASPGINAIAVLPFQNAGGDPSAEWLSDGITESLINSLSPSPGLKVMSRNSVFRYKGKDIDPSRIGRELGVGAVLTGRVEQRGDDLVVSAELVDARDDSHIWGEQYRRKLSDVLGVQQEIAREIASRLRARLQPGAAEPKVYTRDAEAYQDYLRGRYFWNKRTEDGFRKAVTYFEQAIERDPNYALAYSGLADTYALMSDYSILPPNEAMPKARAAAERALAIDPQLSEAHTSLAFVRMAYDWKWDEAGQEFQRAIELNPNYATAHQWYASYLVQVGRFGEALSEIRHAQELDPLASIINANAGLYLYYAKQYDQATAQLKKTLEVDDHFGVAHLYLGYVYLQQSGHQQDAIAEFQRALDNMGDDAETQAALGHAYAVAGQRAEAQKVLASLREHAARGYASPYFVAIVYTGLGDRERAFDSLEQAYRDRHPGMILLKYDPRFDPLRRDPRFTKLIQRIEQPS